MTMWEENVDLTKVFVLHPGHPLTYFGIGAINKIHDILKSMAREGRDRILVITDGTAYRESGAWDIVRPALDEHTAAWVHYDEVRANPTYANCDEAVSRGIASNVSGILAIGGGSSLDTAKIAAALMRHPGRKAVDLFEKGEPIDGALPVIAINTSHGTGSECNSFAVAQSDGRNKPGLISPFLYATYAIEDPGLTLSLPARQTLFTTIDTVNHAIEAATATTANPFSYCLGREAVRLVANYLPMAITDPSNREARYWLMFASAIGGICFDLASLHITHCLQHAMSCLDIDVPHGEGVGILMPPTVGEIYAAKPQILADLLSPLVPGLKGVPEEAGQAVAGLKDWCASVGQPTSMAAYFGKKDVETLVTMVMSSPMSGMMLPKAPVPVDRTLVERIYMSVL